MTARLSLYRNRFSLGLALIQLGRPWGLNPRTSPPTDTMARALIEAALALGITFFDTAPAYGESEARFGSARKELADDRMLVATKFGQYWRGQDESLSTTTDHSVPRALNSLLGSLDLLGRVDLWQVHKFTSRALDDDILVNLLRLVRKLGIAVGASVSTPNEMNSVLESGLFDTVHGA